MQAFTQIAQVLLNNPQFRILVDGHANPVIRTATEEEEVLRPLSLQRAQVVADFLVEFYNVDRRRLIITGAGGGYPAGNDAAINRRVNFVIITPR